MCAHDFIVRRWRLDGTSAEPDEFDAALIICQETAMRDALENGDLDEGLGESDPYKLAAKRAEFVDLFPRHSFRDVRSAAFVVECVAQLRLRELGGPGPVVRPATFARRLNDAQGQAHRAIFAFTRPARLPAKLIQQRAATPKPPLTLCCGKRLRRLPELVLRYNAPDLLKYYGENIVPLGSGDGCFVIVEDTREPRLPRAYCDRCAKKAGRTMNAGLVKNALARLRAARKPG
jgi:hypothetical protein